MKEVKKYFLEEGYNKEIDISHNLYNFISFWYKNSKMDGILDSNKISQFVEDFVDKNKDFEDFEKILTKLYKKLKKIKPGSFEYYS